VDFQVTWFRFRLFDGGFDLPNSFVVNILISLSMSAGGGFEVGCFGDVVFCRTRDAGTGEFSHCFVVDR